MDTSKSRLDHLRALLFEPRLPRWGALAVGGGGVALQLTLGPVAVVRFLAVSLLALIAVGLARWALDRRTLTMALKEEDGTPEVFEAPAVARPPPAQRPPSPPLSPEDPSWAPLEAAPLEARLAHLTLAGGALGLLGERLVQEFEGSSRYGRASFDVAMAVHYAYNAAVVTWQRHPSADRPRELVRSLKDAAALSHWERDDDDGYGQATFHALIGALGGASAGAPDPDPLERYRSVGGEGIGRAYDARLWHPTVLQERFAALTAEERALVLERQRTFLGYLADIYPARMEHLLFLASLVALDGRFDGAAPLWREALAGGAYLVEHFRHHQGELGETVLGPAARSLRLLLDRASAGEAGRPFLPELAAALAKVQEARFGPGGAAPAP